MKNNILNQFNLQGKTALVTGGAGLLGKAHADALLQSGARVVLADINEQSLSEVEDFFEKKYSENIFCFNVDISSEKSIKKLYDELVKRDIFINILINNAAIDPKVDTKQNIENSGRIENFSLEDWNKQFSVGMTGAFLCCKIFGACMASNGGGVILNVSSDLSVIAPDQRIYEIDGLEPEKQPVKPITYSVIKHGLIGLTKYLATYWKDANIRCNALSPGGIYNEQPKNFVESVNFRIPMGRMASVDDYKASVIYLCSDASGYMTGQNVVVDGGRSIW